MSKEKKPVSPMRYLFRLAGATVLGANLAGPLMFAADGDQREALEKDLGLTAEMIRRSTPTKVHMLFPEQKEAAQYAQTQMASTLAKSFENYAQIKGARYDFMGLMVHNFLVGPSSLLNAATLNQMPQLTTCVVFVPSDRLELAAIRRAILTLPDDQIKNFPGTAKDYRKLSVMHELEHCNQNWHDGEDNEFRSDRESIKFFLRDGGNPEVVRATIYARSLVAFESFLVSGDGNHPSKRYTMAPALAHQYLDGPAFDRKDATAAYTDAVRILKQTVEKQRGHMMDLFEARTLHTITRLALNDPSLNIAPKTRLVLELNQKAYMYFITPSALSKAAAASPALF